MNLEIGMVKWMITLIFTNIKTIKKNTINKSLKELAEKNEIKINDGYRKVVKKYWYKGSALD